MWTMTCRLATALRHKEGLHKYMGTAWIIASGKGGVGKSLVSCLLASKCRKAGLKVGILDADITGPSVPKSFGITERAMQDETGLLPTVTKSGIKLMSINLPLCGEVLLSAELFSSFGRTLIGANLIISL